MIIKYNNLKKIHKLLVQKALDSRYIINSINTKDTIECLKTNKYQWKNLKK